jgi:hypothetical protein
MKYSLLLDNRNTIAFDGTPPILTWKEILEIKKERFSFYSHTYNSHLGIVD